MSSLATLKKRMLVNPEVKAEYEAQAPEFELARELIAARARAGLTQEQLADKMQTTQSTIARMESGRSLPSLRTLARYAEATGSRAVVRLETAGRVRVVSAKRVTKAKPAKRVAVAA